MSDYNWTCPGCSEAVHWNDEAYYSETLDDNVCAECHTTEQEEGK